jgi:hypothetical protein
MESKNEYNLLSSFLQLSEFYTTMYDFFLLVFIIIIACFHSFTISTITMFFELSSTTAVWDFQPS